MNDEIKKLAPEILEEIKKAENILLHFHPGPDGDCVGSALAMKFVLEQLGKNPTVISGDSELPEEFSHLPGFNDVLDKDLTEIDQSQFDLFLALDSATEGHVSRYGKVDSNLPVIVIDHHHDNAKYGKINLVVQSSSVCEVLYNLFSEWQIKLDRNIAANLFVGLFTDSGGFVYESATPHTLFVASKLAEVASDFSKIIFEMNNQNEPGHIIFRALALSAVEIHGQVAMSVLSHEKITEKNLSPYHMSRHEIPNTLKSVKGWEVGISVFEKEPEQTYCSFRSRDPEKFDVSKIAKTVGGGGHKVAAGAFIPKTAEEAKQDILAGIKKVYPELLK